MRGVRSRLNQLEAKAGLPPERAVGQALTMLSDEEIEALTYLFSRPGLPCEVGEDELLKHTRSETEVRAIRNFWSLLQTAPGAGKE